MGKRPLKKKEEIEQHTEELVMPILSRMGFTLYDTEYEKEGADYYLRIYIEKEGGIDLSMPFAIAYSGADSANIDGFVEANRDLYDNCEDIPLSYVGATVGTYSGPGAIAIAYFVK